jgi:hypothetical protein
MIRSLAQINRFMSGAPPVPVLAVVNNSGVDTVPTTPNARPPRQGRTQRPDRIWT